MHPIEPEELMAYLDGELAPRRASEAAQHLAECRECQTVAADLQSVSRRLLGWQVGEPGPKVARIVNSTQPQEPVRPAWRRPMPWLAGLAAAAVILIVFMPRNRPVLQHDVLAPGPTAEDSRQLRDYGSRLKADVAKPASAAIPASPQPMPQRNAVDTPRDADTLIIRTAQITLIATDFAQARASLEEILKRHGGHIGNLTVAAPADSGQTLVATLRVPAAELDASLAEIRHLGRVENEQQGGEEVTQQVVDLEARLTNARNSERRLADILNRNTGKIADVLAVENEIDRVRGEIESMEAERKLLGDRVSFATLEVRISEEYKAHLAVTAPSTFSRLHNAAVDGYRNLADSLTGAVMFLLSYAPVLLLWIAVLFFPGRYAWRRLRKSRQEK